MDRPTRRSATTANGLNAAHSNGTTSSSRRRRRDTERDSGAVSDGADTDSSAVAVEMGTTSARSSAKTSKKSARSGAKAKATNAGATVDADADGEHGDASGRSRADDHADAEVDSEDPAHDDDAHANVSTPEEEPPVVTGYATRARRERSQSVVSTASDASSIGSSPTRRGVDEDEDDEDDGVPRSQGHAELLAELEKKKQMVEDGTLAEYCRRVAEFKEERNRLLQSAEWHKNLQLKNTADLYGVEVQRAHNIWQDRKDRLKSELLSRTDVLLAKLKTELATLEQTGRLPTHVVTPKKTLVFPPRKTTAKEETPSASTSVDVTPRPSVGKEDAGDDADDEGHDSGAVVPTAPPQKRRKVIEIEPSAPIPANVLRLPLDDISSDLANILQTRETASAKIHAALPAARLDLRVERRRLLCGTYVFEEGDEVVVTSAVLKEDYIGVISSVSDEELFVQLSTGQKVRVAVDHIAHRRCEIRPFLRGSAGIESLQSSGWVECEPF